MKTTLLRFAVFATVLSAFALAAVEPADGADIGAAVSKAEVGVDATPWGVDVGPDDGEGPSDSEVPGDGKVPGDGEAPGPGDEEDPAKDKPVTNECGEEEDLCENVRELGEPDENIIVKIKVPPDDEGGDEGSNKHCPVQLYLVEQGRKGHSGDKVGQQVNAGESSGLLSLTLETKKEEDHVGGRLYYKCEQSGELCEFTLMLTTVKSDGDVPGNEEGPGAVEVPGNGEGPGDVDVPGNGEGPGNEEGPGDEEVPGNEERPTVVIPVAKDEPMKNKCGGEGNLHWNLQEHGKPDENVIVRINVPSDDEGGDEGSNKHCPVQLYLVEQGRKEGHSGDKVGQQVNAGESSGSLSFTLETKKENLDYHVGGQLKYKCKGVKGLCEFTYSLDVVK